MSSLEQGDKEAGAVAKAPRVTLEDLQNKVKSEVSGRASVLFKDVPASKELEVLTICIITMQNGFTFVGKSACAAPENYDEALGHKFAREDALRQAWGFEGYLLREKLFQADRAMTEDKG